MSEEKIDVSSCSLNELFNCHNTNINNSSIGGKLKIPEYQRPYTWGKKQIVNLVKDIKEFDANNDAGKALYYLGSLILHKDKNGFLNIIDGQQRITTMLILYSLQEESFDIPIKYSSPSTVAQIKKNIFTINKIDVPRIDLNLFNVTLVVTHNEDNAYTFFETQNTGGVRLSGVDIIKSHHLRAIKNSHVLNQSAESWEKFKNLNYIVDLVTKARYWNVVNWRDYPSFRAEKAIKESIVDEFTENTSKDNRDVIYQQIHLIEHDNCQEWRLLNKGRSVRQPLSDGVNSIEYFSDMVLIYEDIFKLNLDTKISSSFIDFRDKFIKGENGTIFIKELFELCTIVYANKFGYALLFEFSLWAFRYCYSTRVTSKRTVRENSIFKFARQEMIIDKIINSYTHDEVIDHLKQFSYVFDSNNIDSNNVKGRFIKSLKDYFSADFDNKEKVSKCYDQLLKKGINGKL